MALTSPLHQNAPNTLTKNVSTCGYLISLQLHRAAAAAWRISRTWKQSGHAKLLQLQPTALPNPRRAALLAETMQLATQIAELRWGKLLACFSHQEETTSAELARDVLQDIISSGAAATLAKLLVWLQQWLEALDLPGLAALPESTALAAGSYHGLWWTCTDGEITNITNITLRDVT